MDPTFPLGTDVAANRSMRKVNGTPSLLRRGD